MPVEACVPDRRDVAGFSLIEVMVALAIFGMAAVALLRLTGVSLASANTLSDRQYAAIVARNQALDARFAAQPPTAGTGRERAGHRNWEWQRRIAAGPAPGTALIRVDVMGDGGQVIAQDATLWVTP
jgi:general secretion pathway protein I